MVGAPRVDLIPGLKGGNVSVEEVLNMMIFGTGRVA